MCHFTVVAQSFSRALTVAVHKQVAALFRENYNKLSASSPPQTPAIKHPLLVMDEHSEIITLHSMAFTIVVL